jgi:hypothetical protein
MPLKKVLLKSGVNRENTRYTSEGGWFECDKIRFRQGTPEKIGGWARISSTTFLGVCRALLNWVTLNNEKFIGLGTNLKYYLERGGAYFDITPIRSTIAADASTANNCFTVTSGSTTVTVAISSHGALNGDFVTFSGSAAVGGVPAGDLNKEHQISLINSNSFTITVDTAATSSVSGGGGTSIAASFQINTGPTFTVPLVGWAAATWGAGTWGSGEFTTDQLRVWSHSNFGEDLVFGPRGGSIYYWDATNGVTTRGVELSSRSGASDAPSRQNFILVSDINRFVFCFGANTIGTTVQDPMLVRWSDQENAVDWTPSATNQAGSLKLSRGSEIISAIQARQEVLVWTDSALYSLQYVGAPAVWGAQIVGENTSIASQNAIAYANGVAYWMGRDKFYKYDGRAQPLRCDLRKYIFNDFNVLQYAQVFAGTSEGYNEIWWFYCSTDKTEIDRYAIYNYLEDVWYYGTLARTAWLDSGLREYPLAATYSLNLVNHEFGVDNVEGDTSTAITAFITSAEFDIDDGHKFAFVHRMVPDITFDGSTTDSPSVTMSLLPLKGSGAGQNSPLSEGGSSSGAVTRTATTPVEAYTNQVFIRIRGRQMAMKIESTGSGVKWQLGSPRIDMRPDGRR